jgi:hypothetical protein
VTDETDAAHPARTPGAPAAYPAPSGLPQVGEAVQGRFTKWGGGPHWEWRGVYLGADEWGHWWFAPPGTLCSRPGLSLVEDDPWVSLVPHDGAWAAGFYPAHKPISLYVDITTVPRWQPVANARDAPGPRWEVTMVDLDLDIVLTREGDLFIDDEDEFEQHQVDLGYPSHVVALAERVSREVHDAVAAGREPFATVGWARLAEATSAHERSTAREPARPGHPAPRPPHGR